jgi:hypothetical protein
MLVKYLKLPVQFDPTRLQEEIANLENASWLDHYQKLHYQGNWTALPLRSLNGELNAQISPIDGANYQDTEILQSCTYIKEVLSWFRCPLNAVRLLKLTAGSEILEHRDAGLNFERGEVRLHIPVITDPAVEFYLDKERLQLGEGECWYCNFNLPHSIKNNGSTDRVHLVIDAMVNDWMKDLFATEGLVRKEVEEFDKEVQRQVIANLRSLNTEVSNKLADDMERVLLPSKP